MRLVLLVRYLALIAVFGASATLLAQTRPFQPVDELTTWYTDRTPIDIEIVGLSEPERRLRFRLERAYVVAIIAKMNPGHEIVDFSFDTETNLPESLFFAVANGGRFHQDFEGVPILSFEERTRRTLNISINSNASAAGLQNASEIYSKCIGNTIGDGLATLESNGNPYCRGSAYPNGTVYVADFGGDLALRIECQEENFRGTGCDVGFPFKGFNVEINFHHDHLRAWRTMISRASEFLRTNEYH